MKRRTWMLLMAALLVPTLLLTPASGAPMAPKPVPPPSGEMEVYLSTSTVVAAGAPKTTRALVSHFFSSGRAPQQATATLDVPATLGLGSSVPFRLRDASTRTVAAALRYWGCSAKVGKGQPEIQKAGKGEPGTTASLETSKAAIVSPDAIVAGPYVLRASFLGEVKFAFTNRQKLLAPLSVQVAAPATRTPGAMPVSWKAVPGVAGYSVVATGRNAKGQAVVWENAREVAVAWKTMGLEKAVKMGLLVAPTRTSCVLPAGIFHGPVKVTVTGYSLETRGRGVMPGVGWSQTSTTVTVGK